MILRELSSGAVSVVRYDSEFELDLGWKEANEKSHVCPYDNTVCSIEAPCPECTEE